MLSKAEKEEIRGRIPRVRFFRYGDRDIALRPPPYGDWLKFSINAGDITDTSKRSGAYEVLARACVVHPTPEDLTSLFQETPGVIQSIVKKVREMSGAEMELVEGE